MPPPPVVGTGSTLNIPASAHKSRTCALNNIPLTTGTDKTAASAASVVMQESVDGTVQDNVAGATDVVTATLCIQMDSAQTTDTASLVLVASATDTLTLSDDTHLQL